jgi:hypothetical protein
MFEAAMGSLESIIDRTRQQLNSYRSQRPGETDEEFISQLVKEFIAAGRQQPDGRPGQRMMALSVYTLVIDRDRVARAERNLDVLSDQLQMRGEALEIAWAKIDELEAELADAEAPGVHDR